MSAGTKTRSKARSRARSTGASRARRLRMVRSRSQGPRHVPFFVMAILLVGALVVGIVSTQALVSQTSFHMQELSKRTDALQRQYGRLRLQMAEASSPARIERQARTLGLRLPEQVQILTVRDLPGEPGGHRFGKAFAVKAVLGSDR